MAREGAPIVSPFVFDKTIANGMSYGCSLAGYDIRIAESLILLPNEFALASSIEEFNMPKNVVGLVHDKSSWARKGLSLFNTVIEPGWKGFLTLELIYHGANYFDPQHLRIEGGSPIAQVIFMYTDDETEGYTGKYQGQTQGPQEAIYEQQPLLL